MSNIKQLFDQEISKKCPKFGSSLILGMPADSSTSLKISGDPFQIGAYRIGDEFLACDYDFPNGTLSQIVRGQTHGPIFYQNYSCFELETMEYSKEGEMLSKTRRLVHVGSRFAHTLLTHVERSDGTGFIEKSDLEIPLVIEVKRRWKVTEYIHHGNEDPILETSDQRITGRYQVSIAKQQHESFQWIRTRVAKAGYHEAEEVYISTKTGLPLLILHYVGKGWHNPEELKICPKREFGGMIYSLWFVRRIMRNEPIVAKQASHSLLPDPV